MTETSKADAVGNGRPTSGVGGPHETQHTVVVPNSINMVSLLGPGDEHLSVMEKAFDADLHVRGNQITLRGLPVEIARAERMLDELVTIIRTGQGVTPETVERVITMLRAETTERPADVLSLNILSNRGRTIRPKTLNQKRYVDAIDKHTIVFGIGPAGTGKTYLAMAKAVQALQAKKVNRIILTRPAVEAGERLGFLPGTLSEKIDPYLRPLYDALHDMLDPETVPKLLAAGTIEVAPLAYMRGLTLNEAFIILDEAHNTSTEQMKMFLTRLGFLPGTLNDKIDPYLRPLMDALHDMLDPESVPRLLKAGTIEVAPLAYMRGRTLNDAFIILDEAQNTTAEQMKMFLTRLGFGSKMVVTGDITQIDLPGGQPSGLRVVREILTDVDDVSFILLTSADVVRHRLVGHIVDAYARWDAINAEPAPDHQERRLGHSNRRGGGR
ncbi:MAG: PhoH family protein [Marmoricola sp.]|nr:PhoH family protein [Marmoricola sp.]